MVEPIFYYVDHTSRFQHNSGIQRCVRLLASALIEEGQPLIPVVWNRQLERFVQPSTQRLTHLAHWNGPQVQAWHSWQDPAHVSRGWLVIVELVCGRRNPSAEQLRAAASGLKLAWLFHDAIPWQQAVAAGNPDAPAAVAHAIYMKAIAADARVFCNSRTSRLDLLCFLAEHSAHALPQLISRIIPLPLAETFPAERLPPPGEATSPLQLLMVSTLERRKNHLGLIKALTWLHSQGLHHWHLELIGWGADKSIIAMLQRARQLGLSLAWKGGVSDEQLQAAYSNADVCLYPSFQEGFGLPVAESLWHRRPCLCSDSGALVELARGGGCYTVNTHQWPAIAKGLDRLINEPQLRRELGNELEQRCYRTWNQVARELQTSLLSV
jgi:glycosyltransferase involved in cell wall biosynthesis